MSSDPPQFPEGLPALFFYEDPGERRQRIEGAQPPRLLVPLPRLGGPDGPDGPALEYPLVQFPWEPWQAGVETQSMARSYASWLNGIAQQRLATVVPLLAQAGAPDGGLRENPAMLADFGRWMQRAFPAVAAPMLEQGFLADDPWSRLGWAHWARSPQSQGYSRQLDALVGSVAVDLALIVADCVSAVRPGLAWQPYFDASHSSFVVGFAPEWPQADLIGEIADFLAQTAARPRGVRGHQLRAWYALTLLRGYERAARGMAVPDVSEAFPDAHAVRGGPRRGISRRRPRPGPPPPGELVAAVEAFQAAGWFETVKLDSVQLARSVQEAWRLYEGEDLMAEPTGVYWRVLMLDSGRTWSDDVGAGVQPGDGIYGYLVEEISHIRGKALGTLWDEVEDWTSKPGDLLLSFRLRGGKKQLVIPSPGQYLSAAVFTGLNDLGPAEGPRLWFVDQGPPVAIVTRATAAERAALQESTGLRLDLDPPQWWADLAPLPETRRPGAVTSPPAPGRGILAGRAAGGRAASGGASSGTAAERASKTRRGSGDHAAVGGGPARRQPRGTGLITAQAAFDRMMRDAVTPALRDLGFTGSRSRWFAYRSGDYEGSFATQKSRHSTREAVDFWVHLGAVHLPTDSAYWHAHLHALIPGDERLSHWTVRADSPVEPVAHELLRVFRNYGWPAIQAALDSPGYPPDPAVVWPRSFAPQPSPAALGAAGPDLGPLTWPLRRTGRRDDLLADIGDPDEWVRVGAVADLAVAAGRDADVTAALLNRLEHDPSPQVRSAAARSLTTLAGQQPVRNAFQAAAAEDEDLNVRWAARYALRLAELAGQSSP